MLGIAIVQAGTVFGAFSSIGQTITTTVFVGVALGALIGARVAAGSCTGGTCGSQGTALVTALNVTIGWVSGVLAALLAIAFIPGAVGIAGPALLLLLVAAGASLVYLATTVVTLELCAAGTGAPSSTVFVLAAAMAWLAGGLMIIVGILGIVLTIMDAIASASG
ncbi:MAG TPA: hypothetical protein VF079_09735 [Sphingomicrobium sp.]